MRFRPRRIGSTIEIDTYYTDDLDREFDVGCHVRVSPPEPDVNFHGDIEIEGVYFEDEGDIQDRLTDAEFEQLVTRCSDAIYEMEDPGEP